ncbi:MAG: tRNA pseudouridine(38-40) synthase TruA, partial [Solobacterium sp.]|nr:tRNA pseudouridine(38-40) synthase TruA [Solobacterium sp.]
MIRYKCTVAYDGNAYCGWQTQKHGDSVQEQIESALERIFDEPVRILAAGRTDAGVNAWGQVFQFDSEKEIRERKLMGAINGFLP